MLSNLIIIIHLRQLRQLSRAFVKDEDVQGGVLKEAAISMLDAGNDDRGTVASVAS